jgi:multidrug efflux pump
MVPLSELVTVTEKTGKMNISRLLQTPAATISFNIPGGYSIGDARAALREVTAQIGMPATINVKPQGALAAFESSNQNTLWLLLAAVLTVYAVLGILYESWIHPVTVISTLPSAAIGAFLALKLCGMEFTLIALIGIILLIGIVKKNAIMLIDFALADERAGLDPFNAIYRACLLRFRPIMMTTFAALLGALPLMLASGSGAELRTPMGVSIVGGLLLSQLLTLFTTPVIYLMFERLSGRYDGRTSPDMSLHPGAHAQEGER